MGKLYKLEIENFKSYKGYQTIGPFIGFTCIIGPNGCGKSNLMDAISFVLGGQSRQLRSSQLKDLIFNQDNLDFSIQKASVKLYYELSEKEYEGYMKGDLLLFSRSIQSSGLSSYQFQNEDISFEGYDTILKKLGVLMKVRNFLVFQGDVESIASKSPLDLAKLIEQVSGSDELATQYEHLKSEKEKAEDFHGLTLQKKKMFAVQCKEVKIQKEEANLYQSYLLKLKDSKTNFYFYQIWRLYLIIKNHQQFISEENTKVKEIDNNEFNYETEIKNLKSNLARVSTEYDNEANEHKIIINKLQELKTKLNSEKFKKSSLNKRKSELLKKFDFIKKDIEDQTSKVHQYQSTLKGLENDLTENENKLLSLTSSSLNLNSEQKLQLSQLKELSAQRTSIQRTQITSLNASIQNKNQQVSILKSQKSRLQKELNNSKSLMENYGSLLEKFQKEKEILISREKLKLNEKSEKSSIIELSSFRITEIQKELTIINDSLQSLGIEKRKFKNDQKIQDALLTMKAIFKGIYGKLSDQFRPIHNKYATAISVALGKYIDAIVVENKSTASKCIQYLRDQRIGVFIFLPLDSISSYDFSDKIGALDSKFKNCLDLIECDEVIKPIMSFVLQNVIISESLSLAQQLSFSRGEQFKIVTLSGHVIGKNGSMTGGALPERVLRFNEKELDNLIKKKETLSAELLTKNEILLQRNDLLALEESVRTISTKVRIIDAEWVIVQEKYSNLSNQVQKIQNQLTVIDGEIFQLETESLTLNEEISKLKGSIVNIEESIFKDFSEAFGITNFSEYEDSLTSKKDLLQETILDISKKIQLTKSQLDYELKRDFSQVSKRMETEIFHLNKDLQTIEQFELDYLKEEKVLLSSKSRFEEALKRVDALRHHSLDELKSLSKLLQELKSEKDRSYRKISSESLLIDRYTADMFAAVNKVLVEQLELPTLQGINIDKISSIDSFSVNDIDWDFISERCQVKSVEKALECENDLLKLVDELSKEIENIQPNLHASDKFDEYLDKLRQCSEGLDQCKESVRITTIKFEDIKQKRISLFQNCFNQISSSLQFIYKELTKSTKHPLGGNAYLTLDNTEEPYHNGVRFTAMPPLKRFRDMDQLSGGEKTIAALALLFSIHSYKPAPFFVLDEVDAALDNVNVKKISNYIKTKAEQFQCIVITLKDIFFNQSDSLIGVYREIESGSSKTLTLDLNNYPDDSESSDNDEEREVDDEEV